MIKSYSLRDGQRTEFFVVITKELKGKRFPFFAFREGKYFVDVSTRPDGRYVVISLRLCFDEFFHLIPMRFRDLVLQQTNGTDIERFLKYQFSIAEKCKFSTATSHINV